ncbi:hypothetical protein H5410_010274 [Solanum commersonii]|uniref:B3 domain-containing protein n=1 Tax=Solanum commersonii TaxID=4109 RepID=A0A9J6AK89_SOLCO|nr:hypothetical protein H5410_010274 [Solanum commersonii]
MMGKNFVKIDKAPRSKHRHAEKTEEEEEEEQNEWAGIVKKNASCSKARYQRATARKVRDSHDQFGSDLFKSGHATQPRNPYFIAKLQAKRRDQLYVPIDVVNAFNFELPSSITIRASIGREFETKHKNWKDGRIWLIGGWHSLCRWNLVEKDVKCICEFVKGKGKKGLYLQVQILHEGSVSNSNTKHMEEEDEEEEEDYDDDDEEEEETEEDEEAEEDERTGTFKKNVSRSKGRHKSKLGGQKTMATMTTFSAATVSSAAIIGTGRNSSQKGTKVKYISGLNSFEGLKANNHVASLGLPLSTEQAFAKIVSSLKTPSSQANGGALSSTCNAALEIFRIATIIPGLVLVGVAVGFVLLRIEATVEESE